MSEVMGRGFMVDRDEWVYGEVIGGNVILVDGIEVEVYESSVGLCSPWLSASFDYVYEGDHVIVIHSVTESTPEVWRGMSDAVRFGVVVIEDGEFDILLNTGELMGIRDLLEEIDEKRLRFSMSVDRNDYELSQSYYEVGIRGMLFGSRDGETFEEDIEEPLYSYRNEDWNLENVYGLLASVLDEYGIDVTERGRYRVLTSTPTSFTLRDDGREDGTFYCSLSLNVRRLGYTYRFEDYQENGYMLLDDLGLMEYVESRLAE